MSAVRAFFGELFASFLTPRSPLTDRGDDAAAVVQWHAAGGFTGGPFQGIERPGAGSKSAGST